MGLLDDAIREHLELKRRHGADPGEIERQEQEALGPPRREESDAGVADEAEAGAPATGELATPDAPGAVRAGDEPLAPEDFAADAPTTAYVPPEAEEPEGAEEVQPPAGEEEVPSAGHEADAPGYDEDPWLEEDEERQRPAPEEPQDAGQEDVLEETPDFLQETPEHDRLWFEQKPPRDFDWDR